MQEDKVVVDQNTNYTPPVYPVDKPIIEKPKKTIPLFGGIAIIVIVAALLFGGIFTYQYFAMKAQQNSQTAGLPVQSQQAMEGWKTYINSEYGFELEYLSDFPPDVERGSDEIDLNIIFHKVSDPKLHEGSFQISISLKNKWTGYYDTCNETLLIEKQEGYDCGKECGDYCRIYEINNEKFLYISSFNENYLSNHNNRWFFIRPAMDESANKRMLSTFRFIK